MEYLEQLVREWLLTTFGTDASEPSSPDAPGSQPQRVTDEALRITGEA